MRIYSVVLVSLALLLFILCNFEDNKGEFHAFFNESIHDEIAQSIQQLDNYIIKAIKENNIDSILEVTTDELNEYIKNEGLLIDAQYRDKEYVPLNKYYIKVNKIGNYNFEVSIPSDVFQLSLFAISNEMVVSLLESNTGIKDVLISIFYIKENNNWKLHRLDIGDYKFHQLSALDYVDKAQELYREGYDLSAVLYMTVADKLLSPSSYINYKKEPEILEFNETLMTKYMKYSFPTEIKGHEGNEIIGFDIDNMVEEIIPIIRYRTNIKLDNESNIKKEAFLISYNNWMRGDIRCS